MSRIYFHTRPGDKGEEAEVRGAERGHGGLLTANIALSTLNFKFEKNHWLKHFIKKDWFGFNSREEYFNSSLETSISIGELPIEIPGDLVREVLDKDFDGPVRKTTAFEVNLNTALKLGEDAVKLLARLHGQCEIHAYVEGKNRKWLSDIITSGLNDGILRPNMGWDDVIKTLRADSEHPVVTSYSVCDEFPNRELFGEIMEEEEESKYYKLTPEERWDTCMKTIRDNDNGTEISPDDWNSFKFGYGETYFTLAKMAAIIEKDNPRYCY